jgi:hypothetical protein
MSSTTYDVLLHVCVCASSSSAISNAVDRASSKLLNYVSFLFLSFEYLLDII